MSTCGSICVLVLRVLCVVCPTYALLIVFIGLRLCEGFVWEIFWSEIVCFQPSGSRGGLERHGASLALPPPVSIFATFSSYINEQQLRLFVYLQNAWCKRL